MCVSISIYLYIYISIYLYIYIYQDANPAKSVKTSSIDTRGSRLPTICPMISRIHGIHKILQISFILKPLKSIISPLKSIHLPQIVDS